MKTEHEHNEDIARLTEEIRSFGTPYQTPEPDELYWANFRVRVMERVEEKRGFAGLMDRVREFVFGHGLSLGLAGAVAVAIVIFLANPFGTGRVDAPDQASNITIGKTNSPAIAEQKTVATVPAELQPVAVQANSDQKPMATNLSPRAHRTDALLAMADASPNENDNPPSLMHGDTDGPVSLNDLSASELESVLETVKDLDEVPKN